MAEHNSDSLTIEVEQETNRNEGEFEINLHKKEFNMMKRSNVRLQQENMRLQQENVRLQEENRNLKIQRLKRYSETCALCDGQLMNEPRAKAVVSPLPEL